MWSSAPEGPDYGTIVLPYVKFICCCLRLEKMLRCFWTEKTIFSENRLFHVSILVSLFLVVLARHLRLRLNALVPSTRWVSVFLLQQPLPLP